MAKPHPKRAQAYYSAKADNDKIIVLAVGSFKHIKQIRICIDTLWGWWFLHTDSTQEFVLEMKGINKAFSGVRVLWDVDFCLRKGEVLGLIGENGAGKSTLMKILGGVHSCDSGVITICGQAIRPKDPSEARDMGISIIHQEFGLASNISVAENIFLGKEMPRDRWGLIDWKETFNSAKTILEKINVNIDPRVRLSTLSVGQMQLVEIARALAFDADIIVMDEPTSALTQSETEVLFDMIDLLSKSGVSIIFISHRLTEVMKIADRITIMRDGEVVANAPTKDWSIDGIIKAMVGRSVEEQFPNVGQWRGSKRVVLSVHSLSTPARLDNVSFELYEGEVLGIAGLMGAGRTDLVRAIFGADQISQGKISIFGKDAIIGNPSRAIELGIGLVPEDRKRMGLCLNMNIEQNITLAPLTCLSDISRAGLINPRVLIAMAEDWVSKLLIRCVGVRQRVSKLSGGNQQKVAIAKWLASGSKVLLLDEPTRGLDVGAKRDVYDLIVQLSRQDGASIVLISSDLPEVLAMSDRVMVMCEGRVAGVLSREEASDEAVMKLAVGGKDTNG